MENFELKVFIMGSASVHPSSHKEDDGDDDARVLWVLAHSARANAAASSAAAASVSSLSSSSSMPPPPPILYACGDTPLHLVCRAGRNLPGQFEALNPRYALVRNGRGMLPLHVICGNSVGGLSRPALLQVLAAMLFSRSGTVATDSSARRSVLAAVSFGATVPGCAAADGLGRTPMHILCSNPALGSVGALGAGSSSSPPAGASASSPGARWRRGTAALLQPARVIELLIKCSAANAAYKLVPLTAGGRTALHCAARNASLPGASLLKVTSLLVARHGASEIAAVVDERGRYALHEASDHADRVDWVPAIERLAEVCPIAALGARDDAGGSTPAHLWAARCVDTASARAMLSCWTRLGGARCTNGPLFATSGAPRRGVELDAEYAAASSPIMRRLIQAKRLREALAARSADASTLAERRVAAGGGGDAFHVVCDYDGRTAADVLRANTAVDCEALVQLNLLRPTHNAVKYQHLGTESSLIRHTGSLVGSLGSSRVESEDDDDAT